MLEDPPFDLLCPGRRPAGLAPVLLPYLPSGDPDWDGFAHLLGRTIDTRGDRTLGTVLGAIGGGLLGREIDRGETRCR